ncbi:hypothetical protein FOZ76_08900 [Verticiella sediminum]|uniref:Cupin domain-containing protein n=1 Tax=Verticiella sediminum TaxID=1247510 RepID=A0A556AU80_9BURK|nr:hypothetical protein [Verticiella sediminum]TSH96504.1 hypothetical protein FOZ76_08900 [Verticiella sediminum]
MKLANYDDVPWRFIDNPRQGRIEFKELLTGTQGDPNNYGVVIGRVEADFLSPRHRHNFDQVRVALEAPTNIGPRLNIDAGDLAYFPEGCYYGPQNQAEVGQTALTMVVQFGGASGSGYMSMAQMSQGARELAQSGRFEGGVYRHDDESAKPRNRDGYEAIWSHVNGKPLVYPPPRYGAPVFIHPAAYAWRELAGQSGVCERRLASFTESGIDLAMLALPEGATWRAPAQDRPVLLFALDGQGRTAAGDGWARWSAMEVAPGEDVALSATAHSTWFRLALPRLSG